MKKREPFVSKISRPGAEGIFPRERLFRLLDRRRDFPIIWVSGPPGSGKTSLVASYLETRKLPCLWYQIDERDADVATFFYYMGLEVKKAYPKKQKLPVLKPEYLTGIPAFAIHYFEELWSRLVGNGGSIVFDNYQRLSSHSEFHEMIVHGLEFIPKGINVFFLSRSEPLPQFARLRANQKIHFIGWSEIRFSPGETREILRSPGQRKLSREIVFRLHKKTDGWAAGLILVLLGSKTKEIDDAFVSRLPTKEIFDYFGTEIFKRTEKEIQQFLVKTAFLPRMTAQMAEKLTGLAHSRQILSNLSENHYFIETYAQDHPVYQYHPLFREFLLSRAEDLLTPIQKASIQQEAAILLVESGHLEEAAFLFRDAGDRNNLLDLILRQSEALIVQGRNKTLEEWIEWMPMEVLEKDPWLLYWLGVCKQPFSPSESRVLFEQAFQLFQKQRDTEGIFLAWSNAVDTIIFEWDDFTLLDRWIEWLDDRLKRESSFPSPEIEARVASSMAGTLLYRQPFHADIRKWMDRAIILSQETGNINLRLQACISALNYHAWMGDLYHCNLVAEEIRKMAQPPKASPLFVLTWKWMEALIYNRTAESHGKSLESISEGLEIAEKTGVHVWDHMLLSQGVYASLNKGDMAMAEEFLKRMERTLERNRRHGLCQYDYLTAWHRLLVKKIPFASFYAETALRLAEETGMYFTKILCTILMAQVLSEKEDYEKAMARLSYARDLVQRSGSRMLEYIYLIKEAQFALDIKTMKTEKYGEIEKQGLRALSKAMELGKKHEYTNLFPWWQPSVMAQLCSRALSEGIEVDYVEALIRTHHLIPDEPPLDVKNWPWPVKIYTLGKFELHVDGKPVQFSGKGRNKPLIMLKILIANRGKDVKEGNLANILWPESEGDKAYSAFTTNLLRLRKLIGQEKAVEVFEGKAGLNPHLCWVDAWVFEQMLDKAEDLWRESQDSTEEGRREELIKEAFKFAEKAMEIYKGNFLSGEENQAWTVSYRERLRSKFLSLTIKLSDYFGQRREWKRAVEYCRKALETDDLAEEFYQQLMICYQKMGQPMEAVNVYRRCRSILAANIGIKPSATTETLYQEIIEKIKIRK